MEKSAVRVVVATDSFKDSVSALEACEAIAEGINKANPDVAVDLIPLADGGEGTFDVLVHHANGVSRSMRVHDPLMRLVEARYGLSQDGQTAFIEMAQASGLPLLKPEERNALATSTFGTGELIAEAVRGGAQRIVLGLGGSATSDGGLGMARALGYRLLDADGQELAGTGADLVRLAQIEPPAVDPLAGVEVTAICDVNNPLFGPEGAAHVYGPQKGADAEAVKELDAGLVNFANVVRYQFGQEVAEVPGAGAAGGMGAATLVFLKGQLSPGAEVVLNHAGFDDLLPGCDLVITGEGRLDGQTLHGKLIAVVVERAKQFGVPVIALCGGLEATPDQLERLGLQAAYSILNGPATLEEAIARTGTNLTRTAYSVARTFLAGR